MPTPVLVAAFAVAAAVALLTGLVASAAAPERRRSLANLQRGVASAADVQVATAPTAAVRRPGTSVGRRLTPRPLVALLERQHVRAGRPAGRTIDGLLTTKLVLAAVGVLLVVWAGAAEAPPFVTAVLVVVAICGYFVPDLLLLGRGQTREQRIRLELADTLDQMTIAVEAGMGFDGAMARVADHGNGVLAEELTRTLQDMRMGRTRRQALEDLAERAYVPDLRRFVRAILQADAHGISVGDVLRTQAAEVRLKRRQRAEEQAQKVPVKVLLPLMLCILPVLFIVLMTPVVIDIVGAFSGGLVP